MKMLIGANRTLASLSLSQCTGLTNTFLELLLDSRKSLSSLPPLDVTLAGCKMNNKLIEKLRDELPYVTIWFNSGRRSWIKEDSQGRKNGKGK